MSDYRIIYTAPRSCVSDSAEERVKSTPEESEDIKIEEVFSLKQEETEEKTDLMPIKGESEVLNEIEDKVKIEKHHDFISGENSFSCSKTSTWEFTMESAPSPANNVEKVSMKKEV
ncbi:gastrula zinc finger protein XlCGF49.1-like [Pimephales promelas]|nr:gastrula zinc finger protein XlCGF49.1-like [Pimephales promelas]